MTLSLQHISLGNLSRRRCLLCIYVSRADPSFNLAMSQKANSNISSAAKKWIFMAKTARALIMSVKQFYRLILLTNVCTGMI